jgi:hypothetical protein
VGEEKRRYIIIFEKNTFEGYLGVFTCHISKNAEALNGENGFIRYFDIHIGMG